MTISFEGPAANLPASTASVLEFLAGKLGGIGGNGEAQTQYAELVSYLGRPEPQVRADLEQIAKWGYIGLNERGRPPLVRLDVRGWKEFRSLNSWPEYAESLRLGWKAFETALKAQPGRRIQGTLGHIYQQLTARNLVIRNPAQFLALQALGSGQGWVEFKPLGDRIWLLRLLIDSPPDSTWRTVKPNGSAARLPDLGDPATFTLVEGKPLAEAPDQLPPTLPRRQARPRPRPTLKDQDEAAVLLWIRLHPRGLVTNPHYQVAAEVIGISSEPVQVWIRYLEGAGCVCRWDDGRNRALLLLPQGQRRLLWLLRLLIARAGRGPQPEPWVEASC
jgi:hypothetical protein